MEYAAQLQVPLLRGRQQTVGVPWTGLGGYGWNAAVFAITGGGGGPLLAWPALCQVPMWRTITESAIFGVAAAVIGTDVAQSMLTLIIPPSIGAVVCLGRAYRRDSQESESVAAAIGA